MKLLNHRHLLKSLTNNVVKNFTTKLPLEIINKKNHYFACWKGNKEMWISIKSRDPDFLSITISLTKESIDSMEFYYYFISHNPMEELTEAIDFYIKEEGIKF